MAVLNHNMTYHASLGCEPSRVFHGRIPHNLLDYKLGYNPNPRFTPNSDVAEEVQKRMDSLLEQTKKNIMQSYLRYKAYYDRKAKASPLTTEDYVYILNPKADTQASKIPFREFRWQGPYKVEKVLPNNNYIVRRLGTNKTQLLHRIRLRKFTPAVPLADNFLREIDWQKDDKIPILQDDLYAQTWSTNFGNNLFETKLPTENDDDSEVEYTPLENDDHPPSLEIPTNSGGNPVEQTTVPNATPTQIEDSPNDVQNAQNDTDLSPQTEPKTGENCEKTPPTQTQKGEMPTNTRGDRYNLRPNPNPNYSD